MSQVRIRLRVLPIYFRATVDDGYQVLSQLLAWMTRQLGPGEQANASKRLRDTLAAHQTPDGATYESHAWLITAQLR